MSDRTLYEILQVPPAASQEEIRNAYRALAWQPSDAVGEEARRELNDAYSILSNPARRAAYDQDPAPVSTTKLADPPPTPWGGESEFAQGPAPLRLWGWVYQWLWNIASIRYRRLIPLNWMLGLSLLIGAGYLTSEYALALRYPDPVPTKLETVVRGRTTPAYVTMTGTPNYDQGYAATVDDVVRDQYYALYAGNYVLFFQGGGGRRNGPFTGRIFPFADDLQDYVKSDVRGSNWAGRTVLTTHYLDLDYKPTPPGWYLGALIAAVGALLLMILAAVRRYTVFVPGAWGTEEAAPGEPQWPLPVEATGTFQPDQGSGRGVFEVRAPASITGRAEPGGGVVVTTWIGKHATSARDVTREVAHQLVIPSGSVARTGTDHTGGRSRPALLVRAAGRTISLRFTSVSDAQRVAGLIG